MCLDANLNGALPTVVHQGMGATHFMPQIVGPQAAARMMLTGDVVDGKEAADMGLVLKAVPDVRAVGAAAVFRRPLTSLRPGCQHVGTGGRCGRSAGTGKDHRLAVTRGGAVVSAFYPHEAGRGAGQGAVA